MGVGSAEKGDGGELEVSGKGEEEFFHVLPFHRSLTERRSRE